MSVALTAAAPSLASVISPYKPANPSQPVQFSSQEPPAKRRRVGDGGPTSWGIKRCMQEHLLPQVQRAVDGLSRADYRVDDIAIQAVTNLLRSTKFRDMVERTNGVLATEDTAVIGEQAVQVVTQLTQLPQYQVSKRQLIKVKHPQPTPPGPSPSKLTPPPEQKPSHAILETSTGPSRVPRPRIRPRQLSPKSDGGSPVARWSTFSHLQQRPYLDYVTREEIAQGLNQLVHLPRDRVQLPAVYHVDFSATEIAEMVDILQPHVPRNVFRLPRNEYGVFRVLHFHLNLNIENIVGDAIKGRTKEDIYNFCLDLGACKNAKATDAQVLSLQRADPDKKRRARHANRLPSLLLAREMEGNIGFGRMRRYENFQNEFQTSHEDGLSLIAEFTNCAGDISAMSWVPDGNVLCGTTAHSDAHNQQYNKPGNLLLCSTTNGTLQAFPDHRIPRPVVEKGENSTEAMRQSQDPWLYASVVSTDYDVATGRAFTSSFDKTVKVWNAAKDGTGMEAVATWHHGGNVNFVAAAKDGSGRVATAADVPTQAIRIYTVDPNNVQQSTYHTVSCTRNDADGSDKWAYFPATMQWGRTPGTQHLLAIGYSPRSFSSDDTDIPEDKLHSGEIALWDAVRKCQVPVLTATTANVFEIQWHPTLPSFIVATSPSGLNIEHGVRTHVHLFQLNREPGGEAYSEFQKLDCYASDINELTVMPNSPRHTYITAGCTDGRVYVWDTAQGDRPIHILKHGSPLDAVLSDREKEDTGVKFTAWGSTPDRFYTGSSDGVVKVWNIRRKRRPFVRNLLEAPGPISCGVFSPNHAKLAIGDATGRVFLFSVDDRDQIESHITTIPGANRRVCRPKPFIPHAEPPPPTDPSRQSNLDASIAAYSRDEYLLSQQLTLHPNPVIGAVQGPNYTRTRLFRLDAHMYFDPEGPLLPEYERNQQQTTAASLGPRVRSIRRLRDASAQQDSERIQHEENLARDLDASTLDEELLKSLESLKVRLDMDGEEGWEFTYEDVPGAE